MKESKMPVPKSSAECACVFCRDKRPFEIPDHVIEDIISGNVAVFAGAGISTENQNVMKHSFFELVAAELKLDKKNYNFPELMQKLEDQPNGRITLIRKIKDRFDYIYSHPSLYSNATRFHQELSTLFLIDTIVTTNWDTYFEDECHATPFVSSEDMAFWEVADRKVLKIHGSINNYGSVVATKDDYKKSTRQLSTNLIGSSLKLMMANKTIIYFGYSARDDDFIHIHNFVRKEMKSLNRNSYIVTLDNSEDSIERYKKLGLIPIFTDATFFISEIKSHLIFDDVLLPDEIYSKTFNLLRTLHSAHEKLYGNYNIFDNPEIILCACYQDGLMDGLSRILQLKKSGIYSHRCHSGDQAMAYGKWRKEKVKQKKYDDAAYIDGYTNSLWYLAFWDSKEIDNTPPLYYIYGSDYELENFDDYQEALIEAPSLHKSAYKRVQRIANEYRDHKGENIIIHHSCEL